MRIRAKEAHMFRCFSTKSHGLRSHKEKEWPSLLGLWASGDQDGLESRTTASCVPQPGVFSEQQPGSNLSKHTEVPPCRLWGSHGEGVKGAMSHTASRLNLSRHTANAHSPLCSIFLKYQIRLSGKQQPGLHCPSQSKHPALPGTLCS